MFNAGKTYKAYIPWNYHTDLGILSLHFIVVIVAKLPQSKTP